MVPQLPRAPAGEIVALDGAFFNRLMDIIASQANLTVTPPLTLNDGPAGRVLSVLASSSTLPAGTGKYKVLQLIDNLNPGTAGWDYVRFP